MTLRQTRRVVNALAISSFACAVLAYLASGHPALSVALLILSLLLCAGLVGINLTCWRCPHCGKSLGRDTGKFCQHCGKELNMDL